MVTSDQLGERTVRLVHDVFMLAALRQLQDAPAQAKDIFKRTEGVSLAGVRSRLRKLVCHEFVVALDESGRRVPAKARAPRNAVYELSSVGYALLDMIDEADRWERRWFGPKTPGVAGMLAIGLVADAPSRAIVRGLADGPTRSNELETRVPGLTRTVLFRRLHDLTMRRLVIREQRNGKVSYELSEAVRELVTVPLRAAHCESLRATAEDRSLTADLWGLLHVVAPLARVPVELTGTFRVHVESSLTDDVYLTAASGRISALPAPPIGEAQATGSGSTVAWCDVLLGGDPVAIRTDADPALVSAILSGLASTLHPAGAAKLDE